MCIVILQYLAVGIFISYKLREFHTQLSRAKQELYLSVICYMLAGKISYPAELSMNFVFISSAQYSFIKSIMKRDAHKSTPYFLHTG